MNEELLAVARFTTKELGLINNVRVNRNFVRRDRKTNRIKDYLMLFFETELIAKTFIDILEEERIIFNKVLLKGELLPNRR